jgi:hypothetical protein
VELEVLQVEMGLFLPVDVTPQQVPLAPRLFVALSALLPQTVLSPTFVTSHQLSLHTPSLPTSDMTHQRKEITMLLDECRHSSGDRCELTPPY